MRGTSLHDCLSTRRALLNNCGSSCSGARPSCCSCGCGAGRGSVQAHAFSATANTTLFGRTRTGDEASPSSVLEGTLKYKGVRVRSSRTGRVLDGSFALPLRATTKGVRARREAAATPRGPRSAAQAAARAARRRSRRRRRGGRRRRWRGRGQPGARRRLPPAQEVMTAAGRERSPGARRGEACARWRRARVAAGAARLQARVVTNTSEGSAQLRQGAPLVGVRGRPPPRPRATPRPQRTAAPVRACAGGRPGNAAPVARPRRRSPVLRGLRGPSSTRGGRVARLRRSPRRPAPRGARAAARRCCPPKCRCALPSTRTARLRAAAPGEAAVRGDPSQCGGRWWAVESRIVPVQMRKPLLLVGDWSTRSVL